MKNIYILLLIGAGLLAKAQPTGWLNTQPITVTNPNNVNAVNYQLLLTINTQSLIANSMMLANGNDLRFGPDCNGSQFYNYWIQGGLNTPTTAIWVKIPFIAANSFTNVFMYFGNSSAAAASAIPGTFRGPNSSTDSVTGGTINSLVANSQRGFRFTPTQNLLVTQFGKSEPTQTTRYVTLFNFATQAIISQTQVPGATTNYTYTDISSPIWLNQGTDYVLQLFQGGSDGYYYGTSSQIGQHLVYQDMRYCNSCTQNTFPTQILSNYHYGYPDFLYYITNTLAITPTYSLGQSVTINSSSGPNVCLGNSTTLSVNASSGGTYSWSTGSTATSVVVSPSATTTYSVIFNSNVGCSLTGYLTLGVLNAVPSLSIANTASATSGVCPGQTVVLTGSGATTYTWSGANTVTNGVAFSPAPNSAPGYTLTGANACGTSTAATSVSVHPTPVISIVPSQPTLCSGTSLTLTATGANNYTWFPSGPVNNQTWIFNPFSSQVYTVAASSANGCTATAQSAISVTQTPVLAPVSTSSLICVGNSATISTQGAANYSWMPGNLTTSSIVVSPNTTTTYTITKWNANCFDTKTITLNVNNLPIVFVQASSNTVCALTPATLTAAGGISFTWAPFGGQSFTAIVSPASTTIYTVTASDGTCVNTATVQLYTNPNPTITLNASTNTLCAGQSVSFTASGGINYTWNQPGMGTGSTASHTPAAHTQYIVTGDNSFGCTSTAQHILLVRPLPTVTATRSRTLVCAGGPSTLNAVANEPSSYVWAHGPVTAGNVVNPLVTTVYTVSAFSNTSGCMGSNTVEVAVFSPTFNTISDTAICIGGQVVLFASGATSYTWVGTGAPNPNLPQVQVSPTVLTIYTVQATTASPGNYVFCPSTQTIEVNIYQKPDIKATAQRTLICRNESVNLFGQNGVSYQWSNGFTGGTITVTPLTETTYTVTGTDQYGCTNTASVKVTVSTCPGLTEHAHRALVSVYPNPTSGSLIIRSERTMELKLLNAIGQEVMRFEVQRDIEYNAQLGHLAKCMFFLSGFL